MDECLPGAHWTGGEVKMLNLLPPPLDELAAGSLIFFPVSYLLLTLLSEILSCKSVVLLVIVRRQNSACTSSLLSKKQQNLIASK